MEVARKTHMEFASRTWDHPKNECFKHDLSPGDIGGAKEPGIFLVSKPEYTSNQVDTVATCNLQHQLSGGFKYFFCSPLLGEIIQSDEHIFQMG